MSLTQRALGSDVSLAAVLSMVIAGMVAGCDESAPLPMSLDLAHLADLAVPAPRDAAIVDLAGPRPCISRWVKKAEFPLPEQDGVFGSYFVDVDGDGKLDVIAETSTPATLSV